MVNDGWTGEERRAPNVDTVAAVRADLQAVKNALMEVATGLSEVVPRSDVEKMVATERRGRYRTTMYLLGLIAAMLAFAAFGVAQLASVEKVSRQNKVLNETNLEVLEKVECAIHTATLPREQQQAAFAACENGGSHD